MKFSWNQNIERLCLLSFVISISAEFVYDYTGIDYWLILCLGISLAAIAIFIIILRSKEKKNEKANAVTIYHFYLGAK